MHCARAGHQVGDPALRHEPPAVHDDDVRADFLDLSEQVTGQQHGRPGGRDTPDHFAHLADLGRIQAVGRLVEYEQPGPAQHRLREGQPLAHPV